MTVRTGSTSIASHRSGPTTAGFAFHVISFGGQRRQGQAATGAFWRRLLPSASIALLLVLFISGAYSDLDGAGAAGVRGVGV